MATWKKVVVSGSNVSQLNNDVGYLTAVTTGKAFSTASYNGTSLLADSTSGSLNFASSSGQGLTISANAGTDTLTFGLAAIPNTSLANSSVLIGGQTITLGAAATTTLTGMTSITSTSFTGSLSGTASYAVSSSVSENSRVTDNPSFNSTYYPVFVQAAGNTNLQIDTSTFTYNPSTNLLTTTSSYANQALSASFASTAPYSGLTGVPAGIVSASVLSSPGQGQALLTTNGVAGSTIDLGLETGDSPQFAGVTAGNITVGVTNDNTINTTSGDLTIQPNVILNSNLTVIGTASFQNTSNLLVADRFILLASGSNTTGDGGFLVQQGTQNVGELFGWDSGASRWAVTSSFSADASSFVPDAFMAAVTSLASTNPNTSGPAARYNVKGNIYVATGAEDIWIYS